MIEIISQAIFYTFILVISVGPITFTLFDISIRKGLKAALLFILGVYFSDLLFITLIQFGFEKFLKKYLQNDETIIFAGILLIVFGLFQVIKALKNKHKEPILAQKDFAKQFLKGFTINSLAPGVLAFWILLSGVIHSQKLINKSNDAILFFGTILSLNFCFDLLKAYLAKKLKSFLNDRIQHILQIAVGIIFIIFGIVICMKYFL